GMTPFGDVRSERNWNELDFGPWTPVEYDQHSSLKEVLGDIGTQRLGTILHAWDLPTGETDKIQCECCSKTEDVALVSEIIEHWCVELRNEEADGCYYRYRVGESDGGRVYRTLEDALKGEGG